MKVAAAPARRGHTHVGEADYSEGDTSYIAVVDQDEILAAKDLA